MAGSSLPTFRHTVPCPCAGVRLLPCTTRTRDLLPPSRLTCIRRLTPACRGLSLKVWYNSTTVTGTGVMILVGEHVICHIIRHSSLIFDFAVCWWRSWASSVYFRPRLCLMLIKIRAVVRACQSASPGVPYVLMFQG